ncbi:MAG TPA: hypothetical protein IAC49_04070 [Candidatus Ventricola intestinavium]|nr:hypothetical protein [Candidatus Ventricola intestinavium]
MNAVTAFENRRDALCAQLESAQDAAQAIAAATMTLEQIACDLAQDEPDDKIRQRQLAVLALARRSPLFLRAARAGGRIVLRQPEEPRHAAPARGLRMGLLGAGALVLAGLAVHAVLSGSAMTALFQGIGAFLLYAGAARAPEQAGAQGVAEGVLTVDAQALLREVGEICQAADVCVSDLALIETESGPACLSGTVDDAMLDLLASMMEASASGREDLAVRVVGQAEQYLRRMGVEAVFYGEEHAALFDVLPTLGDTRTVRPAMVQDGNVLRRGVAAVSARQKGVSA